MMAMGAASALALLTCLMVAGADFAAGLLTRRYSPFLVLGVATVVAGIAESIFLLQRDEMAFEMGMSVVLYGLAAGVLVLIGQGMYFLALARGEVGIVGGLGTLVVIPPLIVVWLTGEALAIRQLAGVGAIFVGILLLGRTPGGGRPISRGIVGLVVCGTMLVGVAEVLIDRASEAGPATTILFVYAAVPLAFVMARVFAGPRLPDGDRPGPTFSRTGALVLMGATGLMLFVANTSFALATSMGNVALVAALAALDPLVIALLGRIVLRERMSRVQTSGLVIATFGGVLAILG